MNYKGFTLTELLVVIVILALLLLVVAPSINDLLFSSKQTISEMNRKSLEEAARAFGEEIYMCQKADEPIIKDVLSKSPFNLKVYKDCHLNNWPTSGTAEILSATASRPANCCDARASLRDPGIKITNLTYLNDYLSDTLQKCKIASGGQILIKLEDNNHVSVSMNKIECTS